MSFIQPVYRDSIHSARILPLLGGNSRTPSRAFHLRGAVSDGESSASCDLQSSKLHCLRLRARLVTRAQYGSNVRVVKPKFSESLHCVTCTLTSAAMTRLPWTRTLHLGMEDTRPCDPSVSLCRPPHYAAAPPEFEAFNRVGEEV